MLESPTLEKIETFFKRNLEVSRMTEQSLAQKIQSLRDQDLCRADLRAARGENENLFLAAQNQQLIEYARKRSIAVAQKREELEGLLRQYDSDERLNPSPGILTRGDSDSEDEEDEEDLVCCCDECNMSTS